MDNAARVTVVAAPCLDRLTCTWNRADRGDWEEL
jgi:hypothetical protein